MKTLSDIKALRQQIKQWQQQNLSISFVPTMGNLHQGHLTLIEQAKQLADKVVVSIFVNPMQFERKEDLTAYPRTEKQDSEKLSAANVDLLFLPTPNTIYPNGLNQQTFVDVPGLSEKLEGALRPGHFRGVSTIVNKLFNLVQPNIACFGQKDFQQLALIKKMVEDLAIPISIVGVPTVRNEDGLAMSSRNSLLTTQELKQAPMLATVMNSIGKALAIDKSQTNTLIHSAEETLNKHGFVTDAIEIVDANSLDPLNNESQQAVILMAAYLGNVRLIDNLVVDIKH